MLDDNPDNPDRNAEQESWAAPEIATKSQEMETYSLQVIKKSVVQDQDTAYNFFCEILCQRLEWSVNATNDAGRIFFGCLR